MNQLTNIAQGHHRDVERQVDQMGELQAIIDAQADLTAQRDVIINHREDQIIESDAMIAQRNAFIEFLQEQVQDLTIELDDAIGHINARGDRRSVRYRF
jgi:hypothetical protein